MRVFDDDALCLRGQRARGLGNGGTVAACLKRGWRDEVECASRTCVLVWCSYLVEGVTCATVAAGAVVDTMKALQTQHPHGRFDRQQ